VEADSVRACSPLSLHCPRRSRISDIGARYRPRTTSTSLMPPISVRNAAISLELSSDAVDPSWRSGNLPKSESALRSFRARMSKLIRPHRLTVPFVYRPRTRPPQPIISSPFPFLSTVKSLPEEWFQVASTMFTKVKSDMEPIDCVVSKQIPSGGFTAI
jgi:hypothetical protein